MALGKVRALHPDFFSDDDVAEASIAARLLFAGLWCFACDNGHVPDKSKQIKRWIYATDDVNVAELLRELEEIGLVQRGDGWLTIPNLSRYQRVDGRYFKTCDHCQIDTEKAAEAQAQRLYGLHVRWHVNKGITKSDCPDCERETRSRATTEPVVDGDGVRDGEGDGEVKPSRKRSGRTASPLPPRFEEFWAVYDHKVGRAKAEAAYRSALRKPGVTEELLISAADAYIAWVKSDGKHPAYTKHPTTWLNGEHWRDERVARQAPMTNTQRHLALARDLAASQQIATLPIGEIQ